MSINNGLLPKLSTSLFWLVILGYGFVVLLNFTTGFAKDFLLQVTAAIVFLFLLLRKTKLLIRYSTVTDYIEFSTGNFFSLDEMNIKSNLVRIVKSDIEEIEYKGFFLWKKLRIKVKEGGKRYYVDMPLRFVPSRKVHKMIEDIIGSQENEVLVASEEVKLPKGVSAKLAA